MHCSTCGEENPDHARFCNACGSKLAPSEPAREVRKTVTVLFCDITGFTSLSERHDAESVRRVILRYFEEMRRVVERHGGIVEKFIGDAVMAVFGMPRVHEDDAVRAVRAAAEMRSALETMNEDLGRDPGTGLRMRIGVNTGEVVAADPASGGSLVTGDAVNVAAKLEQAAAPGEILIGGETFLLVRDAVVVEEIEPLDLPGKTEKVTALRLRTVEPSAPGHVRRLDSPMVGRERPLRLVRQGFENAMADRACELVTILGAAGVGKSRLVEEFVRGVRGAAVYRGRCVPYGEGMTYFPVLDVIKQSTGLADFDSRERIQAAVTDVVRGEARADAITERIVELAAAGESVAPEETFWAVRRFLEALTKRDPLVLVFDDLQWGEGTFLDLVEHIADWSRDAPILLLAMARLELLEIRPTWGGGMHRALTISLLPLSDEECERLITNLLGELALDDRVRGRIARAADGNPLFVEEMLAKLIDEGKLVDEADRSTPIDELASIPVPSSLSALLAARLDLLPVSERATLERASIAGAEFVVSAIRHLSPEDERPAIDEQLRSLVRKDLLVPDQTSLSGEEGYRFRHILIRDAAYDGLSKQVRADLHETYAGWLEHVAGAWVIEQEEVLGYHLERSHRYRTELGLEVDEDLLERAAAHLTAAGRRAAARVDFPAAANLLGRAAALFPEGHRSRAQALWEYGGVLNRLGANSKANEVLARAAEQAAAAADELLEVRARVDRCFARLFTEHSPRAARQEVEALVPNLRGRRDHLGLTKAFQVLAFVHSLDGRYEAEAAILDEALHHARAAGDRLEEAEILTSMMDNIWLGPTPVDEAILRCDEIAARPSIDRRTDASILGTKAILFSMLGRFEESRGMAAEAETIQRDLGLEYAAFEAAARAFTVEWLAGDPAAAERELLRPDHQPTSEDFALISARDALRVRALCAQGRFDEARALINRGEVPSEFTWAGILWATGRSKVLASRGEYGEAERLARAAVESAAQADSPNVHGDALMDLADVLTQAGRISDAKQAATEALSLYERKGNIVSSGKARALIQASEPVA